MAETRIDRRFAELKAQGKKAFVAYVTTFRCAALRV